MKKYLENFIIENYQKIEKFKYFKIWFFNFLVNLIWKKKDKNYRFIKLRRIIVMLQIKYDFKKL